MESFRVSSELEAPKGSEREPPTVLAKLNGAVGTGFRGRRHAPTTADPTGLKGECDERSRSNDSSRHLSRRRPRNWTRVEHRRHGPGWHGYGHRPQGRMPNGSRQR